jgi:hypothetical protein
VIPPELPTRPRLDARRPPRQGSAGLQPRAGEDLDLWRGYGPLTARRSPIPPPPATRPATSSCWPRSRRPASPGTIVVITDNLSSNRAAPGPGSWSIRASARCSSPKGPAASTSRRAGGCFAARRWPGSHLPPPEEITLATRSRPASSTLAPVHGWGRPPPSPTPATPRLHLPDLRNVALGVGREAVHEGNPMIDSSWTRCSTIAVITSWLWPSAEKSGISLRPDAW